MSARSKWWPLPVHAPLPFRKSKFAFPKLITLQVLSRTTTTSPDNPNIVWSKPWSVPLSQRISNPTEWSTLLKETE